MPNLTAPYNQLSEADEKALEQLCQLVNVPNVQIMEIGCWLGHSTAIFAKHAKSLGGRVTCVDTFKGSKGTFLEEYAEKNNVMEEFFNNMEELGLEKHIDIFNMSSNEAYKNIRNNKYDLIFIDGDHIYEQIKNDIYNYLPKLKSGGIMSGHDFESGFDLDLNSLTDIDLSRDMSRGFHCGVVKAVKDKFSMVNLIGDRVWWTGENNVSSI